MNRLWLKVSVLRDISMTRLLYVLVVLMSTTSIVLYFALSGLSNFVEDKGSLIFLGLVTYMTNIIWIGFLVVHTFFTIDRIERKNYNMFQYLGVRVLASFLLFGITVSMFSHNAILVIMVYILGWVVIGTMTRFRL